MAAKKTIRGDLVQFEIKDVKGLEAGVSRGAGCFGEVVEVTVGSVPRIAKRLLNILLDQDTDPKEKHAIQERFCYECLLLSKLDHPNVVEFIGVHFSKVNPADATLIMERLYIDLEKFLKRPNTPLSIKLSILLDVSAGLLYLHTQLEKPLIHRDLTAGNILLTKDVRAKIADLGVSKILNHHPLSATAQTMCPGAPAYMPPEALQEVPVYSTALDIFSFGHLSLYVNIQTFPQVFDASSDPGVASAIKKGELQLLKRKKWIDKLAQDDYLHSIISRCLQDRPEYRPKTKQLNTMMKTICVKYPKSFADVQLSWGDQSEVEIQSKTLQVKRYKEQVDQFRGELDHCHADIEAYKLQAELHKQKIEVVVNQNEQLTQTARALQEENGRLKIDIKSLKLRQYDTSITVEEFMKERRKHDDMVRLLKEMEHKLEEVIFEKVLLESENEELKKVFSSGPSSSSRSPPPVSIAAGAPTGRPPPYFPSHRGHGGSALPNPVRPQYPQNRHMNQQMKSASVDSSNMLSSRGHIDADQYQAPIPSISVASSNPPPPTTRPEAAYRTDQRYQQLPHAHHKSHISALPSPQRDVAVSQPFQAALSNSTADTNAQAGQRPASHAVKGSIQESGTGSMKLPPSMQKPSGSGAVYVTSQERRNQEQHRPEPDSDSVSNVSMESGLSSPTGDGRANANENTLEKGIDGDIRRAAKKQMGGKESSVGGGVEAPYDPNLTCPSCGFRFRIGEIQKFKRHASTCTGT